MDAVEFLVNKLTTCKYFDFTYDAGEALKITQRVKNVIVEPDDYIIRSDVTGWKLLAIGFALDL